MILDVGEIKIDNIRELRLCLSTVIKSMLLRRLTLNFQKLTLSTHSLYKVRLERTQPVVHQSCLVLI